MFSPSDILKYTLLLFSIFLFIHTARANDASSWIQYPPSGHATLTHYSLPQNYVASCGCTPSSTHYPTAALNQMAYGSSTSYGPACGRCFNLTLLNTFLSSPPFYPTVASHVVVKITDLCPLSATGWCSGTPSKPNSAGAYLNFDLAWPSPSIPSNFFPSDALLYGYTDFGVWNISYQSVACDDWQGWDNAAALGSVANLGTNGCCPNNPTGNANDTCPSYSEQNGIPPNTHTSASPTLATPPSLLLTMLALFILHLC